MNVEFTVLFILPVALNLLLVIGAWLYYNNRRLEMEKHPGEGKIYRCEHCQLVYVERRMYPILECPRCQHTNTAIRR